MSKEISGVLFDLSGAVMPNAVCSVTPMDDLVGQNGGARARNSREYQSNASGLLTIPAIEIGRYVLTVFAPSNPDTLLTAALSVSMVVSDSTPSVATLESVLQANADPVLPSILQQVSDAARVSAASGRLDIVGLSQLSTFVYSSPGDGQRVVAEGDRIVDRASGAGYKVLTSGATSDVPGYTVKVAAQVAPAEYTDRSFGISANGFTNDTAHYARMAAVIPAGKTLRLVGAGERIIGSPLVFAQANLTIVADAGVVFKQKSGTPAIDTLLTVSGARSQARNLTLDANRPGNPTASYTGRGELLKMSGARQVLRNTTIVDGHVKPFAAGVYVTGNDCTVDGLTGFGTGRILIRGRADRPTIRNVVGYDVQTSSAHPADTFPTGNKVLVWDGGSENGAPFTWLDFDGIKGFSDATGFLELIVVDSSTEVGGRIIARNLLADFPNSFGPDVIKFVNYKRLDIDGLTTLHVGNEDSNASLRLQHDEGLPFTGRRTINLRGLDLAGHINFDNKTEADVLIGGGSVIGRDLVGPFSVDDLPFGSLTVEGGVEFRNFTSAVLGSRNDTRFPTTHIGRCRIIGADGGDPLSRQIAVTRREIVLSQPDRVRAGMISIEEPLEIVNTRLPTIGRWITDADARDIASMQRGGFRFSGTDIVSGGPRDCEGWQRGMAAVRRDPTSGQMSEMRCVWSGASCQTAWLASTDYVAGSWVFRGSNVYVCAADGKSASSGGPTGTGAAIVDGTTSWNFVDVKAVWSSDGQIGIVSDTAANLADVAAGINIFNKFFGKLVWNTTNFQIEMATGFAAASPWAAVGGSIQTATAANLLSAGSGVNTTAKFEGKIVRDTTNNRLMVARGAAAGDMWDVVDGSASVTPV